MTVVRAIFRWSAVILLLGSMLPSLLADQTDRGEVCLRSARECEKRGEWLQAYWWYDAILKIDRTDRQAQQGLERCLRRCHLMRRHRDPAYREALNRLTPSQAMDLYEQVLQTVSSLYLDQSRVSLDQLVEQGIREVRLALEDPSFVETYFPNAPADSIKALKDRLRTWPKPHVNGVRQARTQVFKIVQAASQETGVSPSPLLAAVVALELANGACNSLDRYTLFLTPGDRTDWEANSAGKAVGVGLELTIIDQKVIVTRVYPKSPAQEVGLLPQDRILTINRQPVEEFTAEMLLEKLAGEANTLVEVEVVSPGESMAHMIKMVRRPVVVPSVDHRLLGETMDEEPIGLLRITRFQESTVQEVKEALAQLQTVGIRGLVIDLRGNPGGLFDAAVQIAELFLGEGVIVYTEGRAPYFTRPYRVESMHPFALPVVVLIDGETASAAEVFAGAMKDHGRAHLMGQTTYGKGTMQRTIAIECTSNLAPGVRLTVAKVLSPSRQPYHDRGVSPHEYIDPLSIDPLTASKIHLQTLVRMMMR